MENQANPIIQNLLSSGKGDNAAPNPLIQKALIKAQNTPPHPQDDASLNYLKAQLNLGDQNYNGLCERFAEDQAYGKSGIFPTAIDAWQNYQNSGKAIEGNVLLSPPGALIYYNADNSNWGDGHVGISDGQGNMISATSQGVEKTPIKQWISQTGQKPLGFVLP